MTARLLDPRADVRLAADGAGNRLVVFGDEDGIARTAMVVGQALNLTGTIDARPRVRELPASADPRAVGQLVRAALGTLRLDGRAVDVVATRVVLADRSDPRAIALIASDRVARIADAVIEMLVRGQAVGPFALRALTLERADPTRVAASLREQAARADGTLLIVEDAASRTIVLLGSPAEVDQAARAAARVDRSADTALEEVRLLPLRALRCEDALRLLAPISVQGGATVLMAHEPASNAVVLRGEPARLAAMGALLARLDDPAAKNFAPFEVVRPTHLSPSALAAAVEAAVCAVEPARRDRMRLLADEATGLLFVRADQALVAEVRAAIAAADVPPPPPPPPEPPAAGPVVDPAPQS